MFKKTITYTDYSDTPIQRTEDFYFNLSKAELFEMQYGVDGGMKEMLTRIINSSNQPEIVSIFKNLISKAYGEKSADGKRFIKSPEISKAFSETEAYSILFLELATNAEAATSFVNGILPFKLDMDKDMIKE